MYEFSMHNYFEIAWKTKEVTEKKRVKKMLKQKKKLSVKAFSFICIRNRSQKCSLFLLDFFMNLLPFIK